jgi:hypothetical protein
MSEPIVQNVEPEKSAENQEIKADEIKIKLVSCHSKKLKLLVGKNNIIKKKKYL